MISLANHWLTTFRGGEKVLAEFRRLFPQAPMSTLVLKRGEIPDWITGDRVYVSPLQRLPMAVRYYKALLPLHPWAFSRLDTDPATKLMLSSDAAMIKGLRLPTGARQVCYCHSPPRYLWDLHAEYLNGLNWWQRLVFKGVLEHARAFDRNAAGRVDHFIANSHFVAARIQRFYGRNADVIYPPVAVEDFSPDAAPEDYYLLVSQLTPYKRADLAVRAFTAMGKPLVVIGEGSESRRLRMLAGPTVRLMGRQPFAVVKRHFERCRAFIHPQVEDFGITAVEAQAAGRPVIAYRAGGALESVIDGETGLFFDEQTPASLIGAVNAFEARPPGRWSAHCRRNAERFNAARFRSEMKALLLRHYPELLAGHVWP